MANRVNPDEVKEIISTTQTDQVIEAHITASNLMVTKHLGSSTDISDALRKEIERWLTAHLLACGVERKAKSEGVEAANITYQGETGKGLDASLYGQQVKLLDPTGILAEVVGAKQAWAYAVTSFS